MPVKIQMKTKIKNLSNLITHAYSAIMLLQIIYMNFGLKMGIKNIEWNVPYAEQPKILFQLCLKIQIKWLATSNFKHRILLLLVIMASNQLNTANAYETSSDKTLKNSESNKQMKAPQVILNDSVKNPLKMSNSQTNDKDFKGQKSGANSFLNVPKQSSLNSLQVSQMPIGSATGNPRNKIAGPQQSRKGQRR